MTVLLVKCTCCTNPVLRKRADYVKAKVPRFHLLGGEGQILKCPYCNGTGKMKKTVPHPSHKMPRKWRSTIIAPCGEPRFYAVRACRLCGEQEFESNSGHFLDGLLSICRGGLRNEHKTD
jgi:hypothetical protein